MEQNAAAAADYFSASLTPDGGTALSHPTFITDGSAHRTVAESRHLPFLMRRDTWRLEDFDLTKELYRGKASAVFLAEDKLSGMEVVLKMYRKRKLSALNRQQVEREIRIHMSVEHRNIIQLYAAFEDRKIVYLVLEPANSGDLFEKLRTDGQLTEGQAVKMVVAPLLRALGHLHDNRIIHRDIKPENILVSSADVIRLADFGMAIDMSQERPVTRVGTLDYLAPEVLSCPDKSAPEDNKEDRSLAYDTRVDVWAVGILAYELLVGYPPFEHESRTETYNNIMFTDPVFPATMSQAAASFIRCTLNKDPASRPLVLELADHPWIQCYVSPAAASVGSSSPFVRNLTACALDFNQLDLDLEHQSSTAHRAAPGPLLYGSSSLLARVPHLNYISDPTSPSMTSDPNAGLTTAEDSWQMCHLRRANSGLSTPSQVASPTSKKRSFNHGGADVSLSKVLAASLSAQSYPVKPAPAAAGSHPSVDDLALVLSGGSSRSFSVLSAAHAAHSGSALPGRPASSSLASSGYCTPTSTGRAECLAASPSMLGMLACTPFQKQQKGADLSLDQCDQLSSARFIKPTQSPITGSPPALLRQPVTALPSIPRSRFARTGISSWSGAEQASPAPAPSSLIRRLPWSLSQVLSVEYSSVDGPDTPQQRGLCEKPRLNMNLASLSLHDGYENIPAEGDNSMAQSPGMPAEQQHPAGEHSQTLFVKRARPSGSPGGIGIGRPASPQGEGTPQGAEAPLPSPWSPGLRRFYSTPFS